MDLHLPLHIVYHCIDQEQSLKFPKATLFSSPCPHFALIFHSFLESDKSGEAGMHLKNYNSRNYYFFHVLLYYSLKKEKKEEKGTDNYEQP